MNRRNTLPKTRHFSPVRLCATPETAAHQAPPGTKIVPGILQARTLEWVAISFSNAWKLKVKVKSLSRVWVFAIPWTAAYQAPPPMGFARQEYWSGLTLPSPTFQLTPHKIYMDLFQLIGLGFCEVQAKATRLPRTKEEIKSKYNRKSLNESGIQEVSEASMKI